MIFLSMIALVQHNELKFVSIDYAMEQQHAMLRVTADATSGG